ncbi:hypothetical protein MMC29_006328 [Sticta canariensis]|nr:hypothetical protein [Sticta canariensis]
MPLPSREIMSPRGWTFPNPHRTTLPRWEPLPGPSRTPISPVTPHLPEAPAFTIRIKREESIIDILDILEDSEFEDVISRLQGNHMGIRLLEQELRQARAKLRAEAAGKAKHSPDFWNFPEPSECLIPSGPARNPKRWADKTREGIETINPKSTAMITAKNCQGASVSRNGYKRWARPSKFAVANGFTRYQLRLTDRKRESIGGVSPKSQGTSRRRAPCPRSKELEIV